MSVCVVVVGCFCAAFVLTLSAVFGSFSLLSHSAALAAGRVPTAVSLSHTSKLFIHIE